MEVGFMPFKIEVQTNYNEHELTIESCSQIIDMLQQTYTNLRKDMYNHFLGLNHLKKAMMFVIILAFLYMLTDEILFIYAMPIFVFIAFILAIVSAEFITTKVRKQIKQQIKVLKMRKESLSRKKEMHF